MTHSIKENEYMCSNIFKKDLGAVKEVLNISG
jgi:hypothetical protein